MDSMDSVASFLIHMAVKVNVWTLLVAIESPPGPFFEVLMALGGGSEQSIICSKSILINVLVICFKIRNFNISPKLVHFSRKLIYIYI